MARGRETFEKRQREKARQERQAMKAAKREERKGESDTPDNEQDLWEQFRMLSETHNEGKIDDETFEKRRNAIFEELGIEAPG